MAPVDDSAYPAVKEIDPPTLLFAVVKPADTMISPPVYFVPEPMESKKSPPLPFVALPVNMLT